MGVNVTGGSLDFVGSIDNSQFDSTINKMQRQINSLAGNVQKQGEGLEGFAKKASIAAAGFFSIQAASDFVKSIVQVRGEFQQIEVAFTTMLRSKSAADKLMKEAVTLAAVTPFTLQDVASGAKQLLAYGFAAKDITGNLEMLGNIASGVGSQLTDVVYLYGTLRASGRVTQMDINQFAGRGIPIYEALANVMKINTTQVREYVTAGKIGFPQIEQAFKNMTGPAGQFFDLMKEQSKTLTGQLSNLQDAWSRMLNDLGKQNEGLFADAIGGAISLVDNYQSVIDILGVLITTYGAYRAALIAEAALKGLVAARTVGLTTVELLHYNALVLKTAATKAYNAALAATPVGMMTLAITALALAIYSLTQVTNAAEASQERLNDIREEGSKSADKERNRVEELEGVLKSQTATIEQKEAAYKKLQETTAGTLNQYSLEQIAAGKAKGSIDEYVKSIREATAARKSFSEFQALADKMDGLNRNGIKSVSPFVQAGRALKNQFTPTSQGISFKDWLKGWVGVGVSERIVGQEKASMNKQMDDLKKAYEDKWSEIITGTPNKPIVGVKDTTRTEAFIKSEIERIEKLKEPLDIHSKAYADYTKKIVALNDELARSQGKNTKDQTEYNEIIEKRKKILQDITDEEKEALRNGLSNNEKEIQAAKDKYDEMRKIAKEAGFGSGVLTRIDNIEKNVTGGIKYAQDTEDLKSSLDKQKQLYNDFEQYKVDFGEDKAKERFGKEVDLTKTYLQLLQDEQDRFANLDDGGLLSGNEQERINNINERIRIEKAAEQKKHDDLLKEFQTYSDQRKLIQEKYAKISADLISHGKDAEAKVAIEKGEEEVTALDASNIKKWASYKNLFDNLEKGAKKQTLISIEELRKELLAANITAEARKQAIADLDKLKKEVSDPKGSTKNIEAVLHSLREIATEFDNINGTIGSITGLLLNSAKAFIEVKEGLKVMNDPKASTTEKVGAGIGIVGAALAVVNSIVGYFKGLKAAKEAAHKAMNEFQQAAIKGEQDYQALLRKRDQDIVTRGKNSYKAIIAQLELIKKQSPEIQAAYDKVFAALQGQSSVDGVGYKHGTWLKKAKTWDIMASLAGSDYAKLEKLYTEGKLKDTAKADFEALKALREELESAGISVQDLQTQLNEILTGTSSGGLADGLTQLFENGKFAAQDLGNSFEEIMKNAIVNSFRLKVMQDAMQPFYDEFASLFTSGTPTEDQINTLKAKYEALGLQLGNQFKELEKITGRSLTTSDSTNTTSGKNTLAGAISGMSQQTAELIAGQMGGQRVATLELVGQGKLQLSINQQCYNIAVQNLNTALKIEANTFRTANNTDALGEMKTALISMDRKMSTGGILAANGKG